MLCEPCTRKRLLVKSLNTKCTNIAKWTKFVETFWGMAYLTTQPGFEICVSQNCNIKDVILLILCCFSLDQQHFAKLFHFDFPGQKIAKCIFKRYRCFWEVFLVWIKYGSNIQYGMSHCHFEIEGGKSIKPFQFIKDATIIAYLDIPPP